MAGLVDVDVAPQIAQAMQVESIPLVVAVIDGRPAPLFQDAVGIDEMRTALTQVMQQLATQGYIVASLDINDITDWSNNSAESGSVSYTHLTLPTIYSV